FKIDKRIITLSALVRAKEITRDEAVERFKQPPHPPEKVEEDVEYVIKKLGISEEEFNEIMKIPARSFTDFPSYFPLISKLAPIVRIVFRLLLSWTPPMFYEMDSRKREAPAR